MTPEQLASASDHKIEELWEFYLRDQHNQGLLEMRVTFEPSKHVNMTDIYRQILVVAAMKEAGLLTRYTDHLIDRREKVPNYGDLMTKEEFIECCDCAMFTDYDGDGHVSDGKVIDPWHRVRASDVAFNQFDWPDWVTHVVWYNK